MARQFDLNTLRRQVGATVVPPWLESHGRCFAAFAEHQRVQVSRTPWTRALASGLNVLAAAYGRSTKSSGPERSPSADALINAWAQYSGQPDRALASIAGLAMSLSETYLLPVVPPPSGRVSQGHLEVGGFGTVKTQGAQLSDVHELVVLLVEIKECSAVLVPAVEKRVERETMLETTKWVADARLLMKSIALEVSAVDAMRALTNRLEMALAIVDHQVRDMPLADLGRGL